MTDEKLIEEAAKAIRGEDEDRGTYRNMAQAALAVFEKAHAKELDTSTEPVKNGGDSLHVAPTDDEREAMLESIQAGMAYYAREDVPEDGLTEAEQIADFLSDAGFRRVKERS